MKFLEPDQKLLDTLTYVLVVNIWCISNIWIQMETTWGGGGER